MAIEAEDVQRLATAPQRARAAVLGVGGVGSNLVWAMGRIGGYRASVYDHDTVELSNLNRTRLFSVWDVGRRKVDAAISRMGAAVSRAEAVRTDSRTALPAGALVFDARDTADPTKIHERTWLKLAYDGGSTVSFNWRPHVTAGMVVDNGTSSYEVVPSFYVPAALLALLALNFARYLNFLEITDKRAGTCQLDLDDEAASCCYAWEPAPAAGEAEGEGPDGAADIQG